MFKVGQEVFFESHYPNMKNYLGLHKIVRIESHKAFFATYKRKFDTCEMFFDILTKKAYILLNDTHVDFVGVCFDKKKKVDAYRKVWKNANFIRDLVKHFSSEKPQEIDRLLKFCVFVLKLFGNSYT